MLNCKEYRILTVIVSVSSLSDEANENSPILLAKYILEPISLKIYSKDFSAVDKALRRLRRFAKSVDAIDVDSGFTIYFNRSFVTTEASIVIE